MKTDNNHSQVGFTLIEMLIVTAVFGVLATVTVPNLLSSRVAANESTVVATLRAISTAQFQFKGAGELDSNNDFGYEYGTLGELAAIDDLRGSGVVLSRNLLSAGVAQVNAIGWATHHGYHYCLYLPDASGVGVAGIPANNNTMNAEHAQRFWTCLAWPTKVGSTGRHSFFINQQGQVLQNTNTSYSGSTVVPPAGAGLVGSNPASINSQHLAADVVGADGQAWVAVH